MSPKYREYLNSKEWKVIRVKVMTRADHTCEGCFSARATEVHHLTYDHIYQEFLWELVALCRGCHERIHAY